MINSKDIFLIIFTIKLRTCNMLKLINIVLPAAFFALFGLSAFAQAQTLEIADPELHKITQVFPDAASPTGAVIAYNPSKCRQIGMACKFLQIHEHGRIELGYQPAKAGALGQDLEVLEREADKIAAINASPQVVFAGWQFFRTGYAGLSHESYRQPQLRAKRICEFAQQVGNWIGPVPCE
jgi:hypothetical protein